MRVLFSILFILLFYSNCLFSQTDSSNYNYNFELSSGLAQIIKHHPDMSYVVNKYPNLNIKYGFQSLIDKRYNFPEYGFAYTTGNLQNKDLLGNMHAFYGYISAYKIKNNNFKLAYTTSLGIGYFTKCFDSESNVNNIVIGSKINVYVGFSVQTEYRLYKKVYGLVNIGLVHSSNGSFKQPNLGLNFVSLNTGIKYRFKEKPIISTKNNDNNDISDSIEKKKKGIQLVYAAGVKEIQPPTGQKFFVSNLSIFFYKQKNFKRRFGAGFDFMYNEALYKQFTDSVNLKIKHASRIGVFLSHEYIINKFTVVTQLGTYLYTISKPLWPVYTRIGLRYNITKTVSASVSLKSHMGVADYIEWGIGYRF